MFERDDNLKQYATPRQWELLEAYWKHRTDRATAEAIGVSKNLIHQARKAVQARAARQGYSPEHDNWRPVPDGFLLRGTSTYYDKDGEVRGQWVKSQIDRERQFEIMREAVTALTADLPTVAEIPAPKNCAEDLAVLYPIGDAHIGMLAHTSDGGGMWDTKIAKRLICGAFDYLTEAAPPAKQGIVALMGDFLHYDSAVGPTTPTSGNMLDADGRYKKMASAAMTIARYSIEAAARKHEKVHVIVEIGNHDLTAAIMLAEALKNIYEGNPRIYIDDSPAHFHYYRFGKCLIATHHGHGPKPSQLPGIMATDQSKAWGETEYRYWWIGHVHHRHKTVEDMVGASVEALRIMAPADAWAQAKGYRSARTMMAVTYHAKHGETGRVNVTPEMLG